MIVAPTVGPVHVSFVFNPWARTYQRIIITKDTFESKLLILGMKTIEFDSIWWKRTNLAPIGKPGVAYSDRKNNT